MNSNFIKDFAYEQATDKLNIFLIETILRTTIKNERCNNSDFDFLTIDDEKIEVKNDERALETGNIAIETYGNYNKPSGISVSKANYWMYTYPVSADTYQIIFIPIKNLKCIVARYSQTRKVRGCEGSTVILIPVDDRYLADFIKGEFKINNNKMLEQVSLYNFSQPFFYKKKTRKPIKK
jgi:hypothetical protein